MTGRAVLRMFFLSWSFLSPALKVNTTPPQTSYRTQTRAVLVVCRLVPDLSRSSYYDLFAVLLHSTLPLFVQSIAVHTTQISVHCAHTVGTSLGITSLHAAAEYCTERPIRENLNSTRKNLERAIRIQIGD